MKNCLLQLLVQATGISNNTQKNQAQFQQLRVRAKVDDLKRQQTYGHLHQIGRRDKIVGGQTRY